MNKPLSLVRTYEGKQADATAQFQSDAAILSADGYVPTSQNWIPGQRGCGSFVVAALLCFVVIGIGVLLYYWMVKPPGSLTVTYELRS